MPLKREKLGSPPADAAQTIAPQLSREIITAAALAIIDEDGLDSFSVRSLATRLKVYPTAIYWYIPNRSAILAEVMALVMADLMPSVKRRAWQHFLRDVFHNFRAAIRKHPNVAPLIDSQVMSNANLSLELLDAILGHLARAGLSGTSLVAGFNSVLAALVAFTAQEFAPVSSDVGKALQRHVVTRVAAINASDHPALSQHLPLLSNRSFTMRWENGVTVPLDESYAVYVDIVIGGIEKLALTNAA